MKTGLVYGIVADTSTRVKCVFCGIYLPTSSKTIEEHTNGFKHRQNMEIMEENGMYYNDGNHIYCKLCKTHLEDDVSVQKHIESSDHANWLTAMEDMVQDEFIDISEFLSSDMDKNDVFCEACDCTIPCTLNTIQDHVNNFNHRAKVSDKLKPLNGIFNVDNNDEVWCKVCDEYIDNTVQSILDHIDNDENHTEWMAEVAFLIDANDISIDNYLANEHEGNAVCNKCNINIPCNLQSLEDHVITENHLSHFS